MKCPYCNQEHPFGAKFCPTTGKSLPDQQIIETRLSDQNQCPKCLNQIPKNIQFCPYCGFQTKQEELLKIHKVKTTHVKPHKLLPILVGSSIFSVGLIVVGYLFITGQIPAPAMNFLQKKQPTLVVEETIDISNFIETQTPTLENLSNLIEEKDILPLEVTPTLTVELIMDTETPTLIPIPSATATPSILAAEIKINEKDQAEIVLIPAGDFLMGSDEDTDPYYWGAEGPSHRVFLDGYWIYRNEVTNGMYQACVSAGACPRPQSKESRTRESYYGNPDYDNYPVLNITYMSALSYCRWIGGRLPTEAEWEKAARGDQDARLFPWGNTPAEGNQANFCDHGCPGEISDNDKNDGYRDTAPVGSYPDGMSLFGLYDTAGNVWEWVFDYFGPLYYEISPEKNPRGPQSAQYRVIRGGGWNNPSYGVRVVQRAGADPNNFFDTIGFRCALDAVE